MNFNPAVPTAASATTSTASRAGLLARRLLIDFAIVTAFNLVIALLLTYLIRSGSSFVENLVFSLCIGTLVWLFADGGRIALWGERRPPKLPFFLLLALANSLGWYFGVGLATRLLGIPPENFVFTQAKNTTGFLIFFILSCASISWFFWNRSKLQQLAAEAEAEKTRSAAIEKQAMQAQLQMLQAQIEPHMLFNTLANLQGLIAVDAPRAQRMLDQLIQYLRATLSSSRSEQTTLAHEFALMEAYLGLMSVRMGARLSYALHLPDELRDTLVPPMLLQPLVENAIKHGLEPKVDGGHIEVRAAAAPGTLTLTVADTGLGLDASGCSTSDIPGGVGAANVRERQRALYGARAPF
jgi:signal transduction histidine kinase